MQSLKVWLETAQKMEMNASIVAYRAVQGAWRTTAVAVSTIAHIQAVAAAAAAHVASGVAKVAYDKAMREYAAATEFQKIVRGIQGVKAFKRKRAAVASQKAAAIASFAGTTAAFNDLVTDARIGSLFCQKFARDMIASACIKRCALVCYGAQISAKRSQRFASRMQKKAEAEFSACQLIQKHLRGVADRAFVRNGVKAKMRAVAMAEHAAAVAMVCKMQALQRGARMAATIRLPYSALNARKMARRAAGASAVAATFSRHNVVR